LLRLFSSNYVCCLISADLRLAQQLLDWLCQKWTEVAVSLPDIYQKGPNAIRDLATARKIVTLLEHHGWLERINNGATIAGQFRRDAWRVVKEP
jgi:hypothetical protein